MSKWQQVKLGELYDVHNGLSKSRDAFGSGYPFLSFSEVFNNYFLPQELKQLVESTQKEQDSYSIHRGDVFITRTSETMDELGMSCVALHDYPNATYNGFTKRLRPKYPDRVLPEYIGYFLRTPLFRSKFVAFSTMTTRASLRNEDLLTMEVTLPPIEVQRKIADVLSAYDDLIENNRKQIKLLEEAAQRLYKEWFIDLRFPGHETTPIIDGIPAGWEKKTVEDFLIFHANGGWGKEAPMGKCVNIGKVIRGTDIDPIKQSGDVDNIPTRFHSDLDIKNKKLLPNDIVFELSNGNLNNIGRSLLLNDTLLEQCWMDTICASFCKLLRAKNRYHAILLFMEIQDMQSSGRMVPFKKHGANGINNFDFESFLSHHLLYTSNTDLLCHFDTIMQKIDILRLDIKNATETRNRLLPKLMTGKLEVK